MGRQGPTISPQKQTNRAGDEGQKAQIDHINRLIAVCKLNWFGLLGYLAFAGITLLAVQDADFFVASRRTQLPIVNIQIPTATFFLFAPLLGAALTIYLHFYLIKLWRAFARLGPVDDVAALEEKLTPWLVNDLALLVQNFKHRANIYSGFAAFVSFAICYVAPSSFLYEIWQRYFPAHGVETSLIAGGCLVIATTMVMASLYVLVFDLRVGAYKKYRLFAVAVMALIVICFVPYVLLETGGGSAWFNDRETGLTKIEWKTRLELITKLPVLGGKKIIPEKNTIGEDLVARLKKLDGVDTEKWQMVVPKVDREVLPKLFPASADLFETELVKKPRDWKDYDSHMRHFRIDWCKAKGIASVACGPSPWDNRQALPGFATARLEWCGKTAGIGVEKCKTAFAAYDKRFIQDWKSERYAYAASMENLNLSKRDLRFANLERAFLVGGDFRNALLQGADLENAKMQGADLKDAKMQGAYLKDAKMQGAYLWGAKMQGAYLWGAKMQGANLEDAKMQGAYLWGAKMKSVKWTAVTIDSVAAHFTDFTDAIDLSQAQISRMIGNDKTILPIGPAKDSGKPYAIASCWEKQPKYFETLIQAYSEKTQGKARLLFLCSSQNQLKCYQPSYYSKALGLLYVDSNICRTNNKKYDIYGDGG